jgi:hypothetical protein
VWTFSSGYIDDCYMWYWRPTVTTPSRLKGHVLFGRLNVVAYAAYGEEAVNQWHDAPHHVGTGLYAVSNNIAYLPDPGCDAIRLLNNTERLAVSRPYISGPNGIWWLGDGSAPANGYYNQGALTANTHCGAGDICNETPYWTVTMTPPPPLAVLFRVWFQCRDESCAQSVPNSSYPAFAYTVNAPYQMGSSSPNVLDQAYQNSYWVVHLLQNIRPVRPRDAQYRTK